MESTSLKVVNDIGYWYTRIIGEISCSLDYRIEGGFTESRLHQITKVGALNNQSTVARNHFVPSEVN